jgi:hypothetical protein
MSRGGGGGVVKISPVKFLTRVLRAAEGRKEKEKKPSDIFQNVISGLLLPFARDAVALNTNNTSYIFFCLSRPRGVYCSDLKTKSS